MHLKCGGSYNITLLQIYCWVSTENEFSKSVTIWYTYSYFKRVQLFDSQFIIE